jgi:hypothetical protein
MINPIYYTPFGAVVCIAKKEPNAAPRNDGTCTGEKAGMSIHRQPGSAGPFCQTFGKRNAESICRSSTGLSD